MKDQITHPPDNTDHSVAKQKFRITNWSTYNKALINRGSLTFWLDDEAIQAWYESATPSTEKSGQHRQTALTTPGSVTMNCGVRKSARLSRPEKVRVTGPVIMQTVTVQWLISE
uniref:Mobile element protein n=1 Tax=Klebsiella pneumoniae TaxID=573 RepID=A0A6G9HZ22_KLEPN|nr:Mobile element protein [Klebsiella pneumoniae]